MKNIYFWTLIKEFNELMRTSIEGPNCIDPNICKGDCCSIQIDVPKVLAEEYIKRKIAKKEDFIRSDIFSFKLRFNEDTGKCFFFDKKINGCKVHKTGIKPPQCWIYPTGFSKSNNNLIKCKKTGGWKIISPNKTAQAEKILEKYNFLCEIEARKELKLINDRIRNSSRIELNDNKLSCQIKKYGPSQLAGFRDTWNCLTPLLAEGISLQIKKFCLKYNKKCILIQDNFLECKKICDIIAQKLIEFLEKKLFNFVKEYRVDTDGNYPFYLLFKNQIFK